MPFSLGGIELLALLAIAIPVALLYIRRDRRYRYGVAAFVCASVAALITPADILSMLILFAAFLGIFTFGSRYRLTPPSTVA